MTARNGNDPDGLDPQVRAKALSSAAWGAVDWVSRDFAKHSEADRLAALRLVHKEIGSGDVTNEDIEDLAAGNPSQELDIRQRVERMRVDRDARAQLAAEANPPPEFPTGTFADDLAVPDADEPWLVNDLIPEWGNVEIIAQKKAGKTTLAMNLTKALADGTDFLNMFATHLTGRVAYFNYEMTPSQFREWARDIGINNMDRVTAPFHLRGQSLPFWIPSVRDPLVEWLRDREVQVLIIDPAAPAWIPLVDNENDNSQLMRWTHAVDELKRLSGVEVAVVTHHTGRAIQQEDAEGGRGGVRLEDWMDAGLYLTRDATTGSRFLRAEGRDVGLEEARALGYDKTTRELYLTDRTRTEHRTDERVLDAVATLATLKDQGDDYPPSTRALCEAMGGNQNYKGKAVQQAVAQKYMKREPGPNRSQLHRLTKKGRALLSPAEGDHA